MPKTFNGLFREWMKVAPSDPASPPVIWGRCIVHLGNPAFSGRVLHTSGVLEITRYKGVTLAETRNNFYALLGPEVPPPGRKVDPVAYLERHSIPADPADSYASAAVNADPGCLKCGGSGVYPSGERKFAICDRCCPHKQGWWLLEGGYGPNNGRWACKAGCGHIVDTPEPELEFLPRSLSGAPRSGSRSRRASRGS